MSGIAELDKWLMKATLEGKAGAGATRDYLKAKMRHNVMSRIANSHGATPSGTSLDMLVQGSEDVADSVKSLMRADREGGVDPKHLTDAMLRYAALTKGKAGG